MALDIFKALSDPTRRAILELLRNRTMNAGEIAACFQMTDATVSHHLAVLKRAGLIDEERHGKYIRYSLNTSVLEDIAAWMLGLLKEGKKL